MPRLQMLAASWTSLSPAPSSRIQVPASAARMTQVIHGACRVGLSSLIGIIGLSQTFDGPVWQTECLNFIKVTTGSLPNWHKDGVLVLPIGTRSLSLKNRGSNGG